MLSLKKKSSVIAVGMALTLGLAACGSNDTETTGSGSDTPSAAASPVAVLDNLTGTSTSVTLDAGFLEGLTALKLTPATIGGAKLEGAVISFPITGGNATYFDPASGVTPYVTSNIEHEGSGLQLTGANGKVVKLENFVVDAGTSMLTGKVTVDGMVAFESAPLFFLDGSTLKPLDTTSKPGMGVLEGTTVSLTKAAADALNGVFETTALTEFFKVGVAEIDLKLPA